MSILKWLGQGKRTGRPNLRSRLNCESLGDRWLPAATNVGGVTAVFESVSFTLPNGEATTGQATVDVTGVDPGKLSRRSR